MATIRKAQKGTAMQRLKSMYPKADTTAKGDLRFQDMAPMDRYNKADQNRINATNKAFDAKYGKDKPAKGKVGMKVKKAQVGTTVKKIGKKVMDKAKNATAGDVADVVSMGGYSGAKKLYRMSKGTPSKYLKDQIKQRNGGSTRRMQAGGVAGKSPKAGMVDPRGAYTKVQTRTLGNMKSGGKMSKKK